jgi:cell wall-associated NlpC family hydrolase
MLGDVLTFKRDGGGHVGIYVGEDDKHYHVLGGNQGNSVSISRIAKTRLYKARRTTWKIAQPANVRVVKLEAKGVITTNEA